MQQVNINDNLQDLLIHVLHNKLSLCPGGDRILLSVKIQIILEKTVSGKLQKETLALRLSRLQVVSTLKISKGEGLNKRNEWKVGIGKVPKWSQFVYCLMSIVSKFLQKHDQVKKKSQIFPLLLFYEEVTFNFVISL